MKSNTRQALADANDRMAEMSGRIAELTERLRRHDELFAAYRTQFDTEPATMQARLRGHAVQQARDAAWRIWPFVALLSLVIAIVVALFTFSATRSVLGDQVAAAANSAVMAVVPGEVARRLDAADLAGSLARAGEAAAVAGRAAESVNRAVENSQRIASDLGRWKSEFHSELRADTERARNEAAQQRTEQFAALAAGLRDNEIPRAVAAAASSAVAGAVEARLKDFDLAGLIERTSAANSAAGAAAASASAAVEQVNRAMRDFDAWRLNVGDELRAQTVESNKKVADGALERMDKLDRDFTELNERTRRLTLAQTQTAELLSSLIDRLDRE